MTVAPTLEPNTRAMAWVRLMSPALTKLTAITVTAEELCSAAVAAAPVRAPVTGPFAHRPSTRLVRSPAAWRRAALINSIPPRNMPRPPARPHTERSTASI